MKYFRMSYEEVVFKRSYLNLILLNRAIPGYKPLDGEKKNNQGNYIENEQSFEIDTENEDSEHASDFFMQFM